MIILDACVLISHYSGDNHAARALNILDTEETLTIHPLTLAECSVAPARFQKLSRFRKDITRLGLEVWEPDLDHVYRVATLRATTPLRIPDCCALDLARFQKAILATFDVVLAKTARSLGITVVEG